MNTKLHPYQRKGDKGVRTQSLIITKPKTRGDVVRGRERHPMYRLGVAPSWAMALYVPILRLPKKKSFLALGKAVQKAMRADERYKKVKVKNSTHPSVGRTIPLLVRLRLRKRDRPFMSAIISHPCTTSLTRALKTCPTTSEMREIQSTKITRNTDVARRKHTRHCTHTPRERQ